MEPKVELYTAICTAMDRPDAKTAIWEILSGPQAPPQGVVGHRHRRLLQFG